MEIDPLNLQESINLDEFSSSINDSYNSTKESSNISPINSNEYISPVTPEQYRTTNTGIEEVLPKEKSKEVELTSTPINVNINLDIDPNKLINLNNSNDSKNLQVLNTSETSEKYFQIFGSESKELMIEQEKIVNSLFTQSSINQKELIETSKVLSEIYKNIEIVNTINSSNLKQNDEITNNLINYIEPKINDIIKGTSEFNTTRVENTNISNTILKSNQEKENITSNNQLEVIKSQELIPANIKQIESQKSQQSNIKENNIPEIIVKEVNIPSVSNNKTTETIQTVNEQVKHTVTVNMSEVSLRLHRIEKLLSGPLEVKIIQ